MISLQSLWTTLENEPILAGVEKQWQIWLGDAYQAIRPFLNVEPQRSKYYPCERKPGLCMRRVVMHAPDDIVGVCGSSDPDCATIPLSKSETVIHSLAIDKLSIHLGETLGLTSVAGSRLDRIRAWLLGEIIWANRRMNTYFLLPYFEDGYTPAIDALLARYPNDNFCLIVPQGSRLSPVDRSLISQRSVDLWTCSDLFSVDKSNGIMAADGLSLTERKKMADENLGTTANPVCFLISSDGQRQLSQRDYEILTRDIPSFDLFIDMTATLDKGRFRAHYTDANGKKSQDSLTRNEASVIAELIERGTALRPLELRSVDVLHPDKTIEKARRKIDIKLSRYEWRAIHTLREDDPNAKRFQFRPPTGFKYAILRPLTVPTEK